MSADVSVILPIYNIKEEYVCKCMDSLLQQSKSNIEIIMVDDGSTNDINNVCCEYQKKDSRVKVITQKNQGVSVARNKGLEKAQGAWICFVDPDDWVADNYIEKLYESAVSSDADVVQCSCKVFYSESKVIDNKILDRNSGILNEEEKRGLMNQIVSKSLSAYYPPEIACGTPWGKMIKREFIQKHSMEFIAGMVRMQDAVFSLYMFEYAERIYYLEDFLYFYRKEQNSACFKYNPDIVKHFERFYLEVEKYQKKFQRPQSERIAFEMKKLTSFNSYLLYYFFHETNLESYKIKRKKLLELLEESQYKAALQAIDRRYLKKSELIFVVLLKLRCFRILEFLVKSRSRVKM